MCQHSKVALAADTRTCTRFSIAALSYGHFELLWYVRRVVFLLIVILVAYFLSLFPSFRHFHYNKTTGVTREQSINCANS